MLRLLTCPVCRNDCVQPFIGDVTFMASLERETYPLVNFVAFSCEQGHVFFVMSHESDCVKTEGSVRRVM